MSFTSEVKEELYNHVSNATHCQIAELAAFLSMCGNVIIDENNQYSIRFKTETEVTAKKVKLLLWKAFKTECNIHQRNIAYSKNTTTYTLYVREHNMAMKVLKATKLINSEGEIEDNFSVTDNILIKKDCCKRAFIRGAFMATGSINDPNKSYHLEIKCNNNKKSEQIIKLLETFNIEGKIVARKGTYVVYIKEGEEIVDILNVMEAHVALMNMENVRIVKNMKNYYNRQVNCEAANIKKTVSTSYRQIADIQYIIDNVGLDYLPAKLQDVAMVRIENPNTPLGQLGEMLDPPIGKSGVNHRLRKICQIANELKGSSKEEN